MPPEVVSEGCLQRCCVDDQSYKVVVGGALLSKNLSCVSESFQMRKVSDAG
jgi:hypothetical protein